MTTSSRMQTATTMAAPKALVLVVTVMMLPSFTQTFESQTTMPDTMTLHAAVLTNTVPLAYFMDDSVVDSHKNDNFPQYHGFQPDLLRQIQLIAQDLDNVTLTFELEEAPAFSYEEQFEYVTIDCNSSSNSANLTKKDCQRFDLIVGDFYAYPARSVRAAFTPPLLSTAAATVTYSFRESILANRRG